MLLLEPLTLGRLTARNRLMFGPHVTNLGTDEREFSDRHRAYYERRAAGGCGIIVTESASVHDSDWPYERSPLARACAQSWSVIANACHGHGSLVIAALDHAGGQGSSAYSQYPLLAPSRVPEVNSREVPKWMEETDIDEVITGFAEATRIALTAGCDGVEINAGQHSLVRQFLSGLTNHRSDSWGTDRSSFARRVIDVVRAAARTVNPDAIIGLRLSCDELAPWAGITPEMSPNIAADLCTHGIDYLVVVRGSIFSVEKTRPDFHEPPGFNIDVSRAMRARLPDTTKVFLQGSIVDPAQAEWCLDVESGQVCDGVEMTRAHIADPDIATKLARREESRIRPCVLCNQACQVRDARNPIVSCIVEPSSGHEVEDPNWTESTTSKRRVLVVGAGPAGLEAARVAAVRGHDVRVIDRAEKPGGLASATGPAGAFVVWQIAELAALGVEVSCNTDATSVPLTDVDVIVQTTGSQRGAPDIDLRDGTHLIDIADVHRGTVTLPAEGPIVILDPIGGPIGVHLATTLAHRAILITPDNIAGNELSRTGDLAPANVRLAQCGVTIHRRSVPRAVSRSHQETMLVTIQDRFSGVVTDVECVAVVDAGFRLPTEPITSDGRLHLMAGDCVAPRTILEAVLEGRRVALRI